VRPGPYTVIIDRPASAGGGGLGLNGGELLYLAVAGCVSNDLFREAQADGIALRRVRVRARGDFTGDPAVSTEITYEVDVAPVLNHVARGSQRSGHLIPLGESAVWTLRSTPRRQPRRPRSSEHLDTLDAEHIFPRLDGADSRDDGALVGPLAVPLEPSLADG
jgi:OsmC-like protein